MRGVSPHHFCPPLPLPSAHGWDSVPVPPLPPVLHSMKFFFPTRKAVSGQPQFPLCLWGLLMSLVRLQTDWITPHVEVRTLQLRSRLWNLRLQTVFLCKVASYVNLFPDIITQSWALSYSLYFDWSDRFQILALQLNSSPPCQVCFCTYKISLLTSGHQSPLL